MTEQKKRLLKAKIAVALQNELGRVPKEDEIDNVFLLARVMYKAVLGLHSESEKQQVYRTAWKNIHDWIDAQLALVKTEMVKMEEVFLPYMQDKQGVTFFERMEQQGFLLDSGKSQE